MRPIANSIYDWLHRRLIWCLLLVYALGALWPEFGLWIRGASASGHSSGWMLKVMLGLLVFNAGLGLDVSQFPQLIRRWRVLAAALVAGAVVPVASVLALGAVWVSVGLTATAAGVVFGLAVVAAMPAAVSSTAWSQNADGNLALSLGLVFLSTIISPLVASGVLGVASGLLTSMSETCSADAAHVAAVFLALWVVGPALGGIVVRGIVGSGRIHGIKPYLKLVNLANLLMLNYANAALCLPGVVRQPAWPTLAMVLLPVVGLTLIAYMTGELVARINRVDRTQRTSLLFGAGMRNNGAALVLVSTSLADPGIVLLPIIFYNLVQHLAAGVVDRYVVKGNGNGAAAADALPSGSQPENGRPSESSTESVNLRT